MEPEIARRCIECGAAIRARSAYCPQCGASLAGESATVTPAPAAENPQPDAADSELSAEAIPPVPETEAATKAAAPVQKAALAQESTPFRDSVSTGATIENPPQAKAGTSVSAPVGSAVPEKRQRGAAAAPPVAPDGALPRAEKLRRASNVVLDEAAADPSLRFVLVATALIILSLLLLLLSRIL